MWVHKGIMDKAQLRKSLLEQRLNMPDRLQRAAQLQQVLRIWLVGQPDRVIGAYWPIKGEFDPLPALYRWQEDAALAAGPASADMNYLALNSAAQNQGANAPRTGHKIGLPVVDKLHKTLSFHAWYPGCPMEEDAFGIPKPKGTERVVPTLLLVPCLGYGAGGNRLGYGGGFYDRTLAALQPRPTTVGLGYTLGYVDELQLEAHDVPLDAILNDNGVVWPV